MLSLSTEFQLECSQLLTHFMEAASKLGQEAKPHVHSQTRAAPVSQGLGMLGWGAVPTARLLRMGP